MSPALRRAALVVAQLALLAAIPVLAIVGFQSVLSTTDGQLVDADVAPDEPGYEALVEPTPVALVVRTGVAEELVGLELLVLAGGSGSGGTVITIPPTTFVELEDGSPATLEGVWSTGDVPAFGEAVGEVLGVSHGTVEYLNPQLLAAAIDLAAPLTVQNGDTLPGFDSGAIDLDGADAVRYMSLREDDESALVRLTRADAVWTSWLDRMAEDPGRVPGERSVGIGRFAGGIAAGPHRVIELPVTPLDLDGIPAEEVDEAVEGVDGPTTTTATTRPTTTTTSPDAVVYPPPPVPTGEVLVPRRQAILDIVGEAIAFPAPARPGDRLRVRVLDGVGSPGLSATVGREVGRSGEQTVVIGNTDEFGVATSRVVYFDPAFTARVERLAASLGIDAVERGEGPPPDDLVDVTVVVGSDLASAYGAGDRPVISVTPTGETDGADPG